MPTRSITYTTDAAITFDLSALATSASLVAGRESSQIDNTVNKYVDAIVHVRGIIGHASTPPVIGQFLQLFLWGSPVSLATTPIDVLDGTDSVETLSHASVLNSLIPVASPSVTVATAALTYFIMPFSVAQFFGGIMPRFWGLYAAHNHAGALGASNNSLFSYTGIKYDSA